MLKQAEVAKQIATLAHYGQMRRDGKPYITHPEAVAEIVKTCFPTFSPLLKTSNLERLRENTLAVAYLHDVIEDTAWTHSDIKYTLRRSGVSEVDSYIIANACTVLSHKKDEKYSDYITRIVSGPSQIVKIVKYCDMIHNMNCCKAQKDEKSIKQLKKYDKHFTTVLTSIGEY